MKYPVNCNKCTQALYGPVKYCPFCGTASPSITATDDKQNLDTLRSEISSLLGAGKYAPNIREAIRQKGKAIGISEAAADSLLREVLKEKGFSPVEDGVGDPLAVEWYAAEKKPDKVTPHAQTETAIIEEPQPTPEKPLDVKTPAVTPPEHIITPEPPSPSPPLPNPLFWKVAAVFGTTIIIAGLFYAKKESGSPTAPKTEQVETVPQRTVEQPKKTRTEVPEAPKPQVEQNVNPQPAEAANLDAERERIRQEAEKEVLAKVEAERQRQEQINRQREIENQRQKEAARQREIDDYLSDGKGFFENGKYELCIEKMKEVLRRDRNNREAERYIQIAQQRLSDAKRQFENLKFGGQE